jgi:CRP/FNR family transcriptional regulator
MDRDCIFSNRQSGRPAVSGTIEPSIARAPVMSTTMASHSSALGEALLRGKQELLGTFGDAASISLRAGGAFPTAAVGHYCVYRLRSGWACQYAELPEDRRVMIDIYLPGDFIGLDAAFKTRPLANVLALTSIEVQAADARTLLSDAIASPSTMLFVAWLLGRRQRRADRLLAAISGCDARGRLAMMVLDLYNRLRTRKLITTATFQLPLTQQHIGEYLGLTEVHVNRVLKALRTEQIARLERHSLTILDMRRLVLLSRKREVRNITSGVGPQETPFSEASHAIYANTGIGSSIAASA